AAEGHVLVGFGDRLFAAGVDFRPQSAQLFQIGRCREDEDAAVPRILAAIDELPCRLQIRLLDESIDLECLIRPAFGLALADITVAGFGTGRYDAEGDQRTLHGRLR